MYSHDKFLHVTFQAIRVLAFASSSDMHMPGMGESSTCKKHQHPLFKLALPMQHIRCTAAAAAEAATAAATGI